MTKFQLSYVAAFYFVNISNIVKLQHIVATAFLAFVAATSEKEKTNFTLGCDEIHTLIVNLFSRQTLV